MTLAERLEHRRAQLKEKQANLDTEAAALDAAQRAHDRKQRDRRRSRVGTLVQHAGFFVFDDATLAKLFTALTPLTDCPNPVAVLDALLLDAGPALSRRTPVQPLLDAVEASAGGCSSGSPRTAHPPAHQGGGDGEGSPSGHTSGELTPHHSFSDETGRTKGEK